MHKALYFTPNTDDSVKCQLCPHNCNIKSETTGICGVRKNTNGT